MSEIHPKTSAKLAPRPKDQQDNTESSCKVYCSDDFTNCRYLSEEEKSNHVELISLVPKVGKSVKEGVEHFRILQLPISDDSETQLGHRKLLLYYFWYPEKNVAVLLKIQKGGEKTISLDEQKIIQLAKNLLKKINLFCD